MITIWSFSKTDWKMEADPVAERKAGGNVIAHRATHLDCRSVLSVSGTRRRLAKYRGETADEAADGEADEKAVEIGVSHIAELVHRKLLDS